MRTPGFWYRPPGLAAALLAPLGGLYGTAGTLRRKFIRPLPAGVPVICIGNLVAGGAGKTPVALAVAAALPGRDVHFLSRGYGGRETGPLRVDPAKHTAADVGDEPLLLAGRHPTWIARDRIAGARAAVADGAGLLILDDGFQNPALVKDLSLLVVDGAVGLGNRRLIPAGPLRERVSAGLARADAVVLIGEDRTGFAATADGLPILRARIVPDEQAADLRGRRVLPFAGIGRPAKFFETCAALGAEIVETLPLPDHHPYTEEDAGRIVARAGDLGAIPVTTAKDFVRLPPAVRTLVRTVPVTVVWDDPRALAALAAKILPTPHGQ